MLLISSEHIIYNKIRVSTKMLAIIACMYLLFDALNIYAEAKLVSNCVYNKEEKLNANSKVCYYSCDDGEYDIQVDSFEKCPFLD